MDGNRLIWIKPTGDDGQPIDIRFETAAYELAAYAISYRQDELCDPAIAASLLEEAAWICSGQARVRVIRSPKKYLLLTFQRMVNRRIQSGWRIAKVEPEILDQLPPPGGPPSDNDAERALLFKEILAQLDDKTRQILLARVTGRSVRDIARDLGVTPNAVSQRLKNGLARIRRLLEI